MKPGASLQAIEAEALRAYRSVSVRGRDPELKERIVAEPLLGGTVSNPQRIRIARWLVGGAVVLVLLVVANLVNLLVARNLGRARETGIRIAVGGGWGRLFRYYLLECVVLSLLAGGASILAVRLAGPIARSALFPGVEWAAGPVTDRVVTIAFVASIALGAAVAALTTLYAGRVDPVTLLSAGGGSRVAGGRGSRRVRFALVGVQAALSLVLLVASSGFIRSFREAVGSALGFTIDGLIQAEVPEFRGDTSLAHSRAFYARLHEHVRRMPGVASASLGYMGPWWNNRNEAVSVPGRDSLPTVPNFGEPAFDAVTPDYLATMQLRLRAGRWFSELDGANAPPVLIVNEALAQL
jgi:hypothetical protein